MIITVQPGAGVNGGHSIHSNGVDYAYWNNSIHLDTRTIESKTELRLVRFHFGRAFRHWIEVPGQTLNVDYNVVVELVRVYFHPSTGTTNYGTPLANGFLNKTVGSAPPDSTASWRKSFQIRRGFDKRWDWDSAIRLGRDPATGGREALVERIKLNQPATLLSTVFSYRLDFATSPEDVLT